MSGPNGGMTLTANLTQSGMKLTGRLDGPGAEPMQIQDGRVEADKDDAAVKMEGGPGGVPGPITLKRVK